MISNGAVLSWICWATVGLSIGFKSNLKAKKFSLSLLTTGKRKGNLLIS